MLPSIFGEGLFDDFFDFPFERASRGHDPLYGKHGKNLMKTDIKEKENSYEVAIDLPGFKKEDIKIHLEDGFLTVTAQKTLDKDEKDQDGHYIRRERYSGQCSRNFYVGENVTENEISAKLEDGILKLCVPKKDAKKLPEKKYIAIE